MANQTSKQLRDEAYNQLIKATHEKALNAMMETSGQYNYAMEQAKQDAALANAAQKNLTDAVIQQTRQQLQGLNPTYAPGQSAGVVNPALANAQREAINTANAELAYYAGEQAAPTQAPTPYAGVNTQVTQGGIPLSTGMGRQAMTQATGDLYQQALQGARTTQMGEVSMREWEALQDAAAKRQAQEAEIAYRNETLAREQAFQAKQNELARQASIKEAEIRYGSSGPSAEQQLQLANAYYSAGSNSKLANALNNASASNKGIVTYQGTDSKGAQITKGYNIDNLRYSLLAAVGQAAGAPDTATRMYILNTAIAQMDVDSRTALAKVLFGQERPELISPTNLLPFVDTSTAPTPTTQIDKQTQFQNAVSNMPEIEGNKVSDYNYRKVPFGMTTPVRLAEDIPSGAVQLIKNTARKIF